METDVTAVELRELWSRWKDDGDERARERLVVAYAPLVKYVAARTSTGLPGHVEEAGTLISYGLLGLIGAIERFDPERAIKTRASRWRGSVNTSKSCVAQLGSALRAPRAGDREDARDARARPPAQPSPEEEVAARLDMDVEEFREALLEIENSSVLALDDLWTVTGPGGGQVSLLDTIRDPGAVDPQEEIDVTELKGRLAIAIESLPDRSDWWSRCTTTRASPCARSAGPLWGWVPSHGLWRFHTKAVLGLRSNLQSSPRHIVRRCRFSHRTGSGTWP